MNSGSWHCAQNDTAALLDWVHGQLMAGKGATGSSRPAADSIEIRSEALAGWAVFLAIILFPIGLLALLAKDRRALVVRLVPAEGGGSTMWVSGGASPGVTKQMASVYHQTAVAP